MLSGNVALSFYITKNVSWKLLCGEKEGEKKKTSCSSDLLLGARREGLQETEGALVCMCVCRERLGKIRNKKEEKGCWGSLYASGVALYVNQKHKVSPP